MSWRIPSECFRMLLIASASHQYGCVNEAPTPSLHPPSLHTYTSQIMQESRAIIHSPCPLLALSLPSPYPLLTLSLPSPCPLLALSLPSPLRPCLPSPLPRASPLIIHKHQLPNLTPPLHRQTTEIPTPATCRLMTSIKPLHQHHQKHHRQHQRRGTYAPPKPVEGAFGGCYSRFCGC